jgi:hypothetical protein
MVLLAVTAAQGTFSCIESLSWHFYYIDSSQLSRELQLVAQLNQVFVQEDRHACPGHEWFVQTGGQRV